MVTNLCISVILDMFARYPCFKFSKVQGKRFEHCSEHGFIDVLQIYVSAEEDQMKKILKISFQ